MSDTLRDRIARALYDECCQQDAYVDTAHGKYIPDPTDPEDWITVDGRLRFTELAEAVIAALGLQVRWRADLGYDGYSNCQTRSEAAELVDDFNAGLAGEVEDGERAIATQATDTRLLAIGSCIALIEHTTALAQAAESPHTAAVIAEWSNKITTAMRMASAHITS